MTVASLVQAGMVGVAGAIGALVRYLLIGPTRRLFINVGFLGAYTTFSSLALGDVLLFAKGQWFPALLYIVFSIVGGVLAVLVGDWLGEQFIHTVRRPATPGKTTHKLTEKLPGFHIDQKTSRLDIQDDVLLPDELKRHG